MTPVQDKKREALTLKLAKVRRREEEARAERLAKENNLPYVDLSTMPVDPDDLFILPEAKAKKAQMVVIKKSGSILRIGIKDPQNSETKKIIEELKSQGYECRLFVISLSSLLKKWEEYSIAAPAAVSIKGVFVIQQEELKKFEQSLQTIQELQKIINQISTSQLLTILAAGAIKMKASDIHVEPEKEKIRLRYRIDGILQDITDFPQKEYRFFVSRIKTLSEMLLNVQDVTQDGRFTIKIMQDKETIKSIDIRVSVLPSGYGESVVMRLLGSSAIKLNLPDLGIRPELFEIAKRQISRPNGMILTTGPTGSGKTSTLYACLNYINKPETKIITVEDPIEYKLEGITQTQIKERKGQTFVQALRAVVRQDPDVLMVGEIRDEDSVNIAIQFALTGHLVFSTLHTNDAAGAISRLVDMGAKKSIVPTAVNLIVAQRLVRRLCPKCKEAYNPSGELIESAKKIFSLISPKSGIDIPRDISTFYKAKGCPECHGIGYKGRVGIFEFFTISDTVEKLILAEATSYDLRIKAMQEGMVTLMQDAMLKVVEGLTSMEEVKRIIGSPQYLEQLYGKAIMSMLTRALVIDKEVSEWAQALGTDTKKIQGKISRIKVEDSVEYLAAIALKLNASDIHFEAEENIFRIRLRIDTALEEVAQIQKELFLPIITRIKELSGMKIDVHTRAQDGRFKIEYADGTSYDTRVSSIPSGYGESVIIRLLKPDISVLTLEQLGMHPESLKILQKAIQSPNGIIFVTGPTSSGKTTTLYAVLSQLNGPEVKIFTIEDPIEYRLKGVIQTQIDKEEKYDFSDALRALLRQNPNIIMLGETRDAETAKAAVQASLTGHLVLSTLHTNSSAESIQRLASMDVERSNISSSLRAIVAQRLVRKLCPECKEEAELSPEISAKIQNELKDIPENYKKDLGQVKLYKPRGCPKCNNKGYKGLVGLYEIMVVDEEVKKAILSSVTANDLQKLAQEHGMVTLYQDGLIKILKGETTLEEVNRVTGHM